MNLVKLHKCGLEVSEICLGADHFGTKFDRDAAFELLDRFRDAGGNFVDTANIYARDFENGFSRSERILSEYLKTRGKSSLVVATKGGHPNVKTMHTTQQLSELKTVQLLCFFYLSLFVDTCHGDIIKLIVNAGIADRIREHGKFVVNVVAGFLHR